jgi:hypothetical protein
MRVLFLTEQKKAEIQRLIRYAEDHVVLIDHTKRVLEGIAPPVGDDPQHVVHVDLGYRCVFSIEEQPMGLCRHLSVSINRKGKWPAPEAVNVLLEAFGFRRRVGDTKTDSGLGPPLMLYLEEEEVEAVNILEELQLTEICSA